MKTYFLIGLVILLALYSGRGLYRFFTGKDGCASCDHKNDKDGCGCGSNGCGHTNKEHGCSCGK